MHHIISDHVFQFIQRTQIALGEWTTSDARRCISATWDVLLRPPGTPRCGDLERPLIALIVTLIAERLFPRLLAHDAMKMALPAKRHPEWDLRAAHALSIIAAQYANPALHLRHIAAGLGLSTWHTCTMLRMATGYGVPTHVNGLRVLAASRHLTWSTEPIKAIAIDVGYRETAELDRAFQRWLKMSPGAFRRGAGAAAPLRHLYGSELQDSSALTSAFAAGYAAHRPSESVPA